MHETVGFKSGSTLSGSRIRKKNTFDPVESYDFRKIYGAKSTDYFSSFINLVTTRFHRSLDQPWYVPPHTRHARDLLPTSHTLENPLSALCTQWTNTVYNHDSRTRFEALGRSARYRGQFSQIIWSSRGRRLIASTTTGELVLWNGYSYTIENRTIAHDNVPCRVLKDAPRSGLIFSADDQGEVKIWEQTLQCVAHFEAHSAAGGMIRELTLAPSEEKFSTGAKDGTAKIWDTRTLQLETKLQGHGSDVTSVSWHPHMALVATSSLDREIRLWDPRVGGSHIGVLQGHLLGVNRVRFNRNEGNLLLTSSKDKTIKLWDLRTLAPLHTFRGHTKEPTNIEWHPYHKDLFASVGLDGTLAYFVRDYGDAVITQEGGELYHHWVAAVPRAHGSFHGAPTGLQSLAWHPLGHVIATCAWDGRLWTRNLPGAEVEIGYIEEKETSFDLAASAESRLVLKALRPSDPAIFTRGDIGEHQPCGGSAKTETDPPPRISSTRETQRISTPTKPQMDRNVGVKPPEDHPSEEAEQEFFFTLE